MITRTIESKEASVVVMNMETMTMTEHTFGVETTDTDKALKQLRKQFESDTLKLVAVREITVKTELRGMSEETFYMNSIALNPVTRKPL